MELSQLTSQVGTRLLTYTLSFGAVGVLLAGCNAQLGGASGDNASGDGAGSADPSGLGTPGGQDPSDPDSIEHLQSSSSPGFARLTRAEYGSTVFEALGIRAPLALVPSDGRVGPFTSNVDVSPDPVHPYLLAAEDIAQFAIPAVLPACSGPITLECVRDNYQEPLAKLFRRSLQAAEIESFASQLDSLLSQGVPAETATQSVLSGALVNPDFLFRSASIEGADSQALRLAEHLSYSLWDAPPDQELLSSVAASDANSGAVLGLEAMRLLQDERAIPVMARFLAQWLHVDTDNRLEEAGYESSPLFLELLAFAEDALKNDVPVTSFVSGTRGFVHAENTAAYALPENSAGDSAVNAVNWDSTSARRGLLGQEVIQDALRHPDKGRRVIFRGLLVRKSLLCDEIPSPNAELLALNDEIGDRLEDTRCAGCHKLMDPIGRVFASLDLDHVGELQSAEVAGRPEVAGSYETLPAMLDQIADSRVFAECFSKQFLGFFMEHTPKDADPALVSDLADAIQAGAGLGGLVQQLMLGLDEHSQTLIPWCQGI